MDTSLALAEREQDHAGTLAGGHPSSGLHFGVAKSLQDVLDAWMLVGAAHARAGVPGAEHGAVSTVPEAIGPQSLVVMGWIGQLAVSTVTGILDGPHGLPLGRVFAGEVDQLRSMDRRLMELTLFADRRAQVSRSFTAILELMRYMYYFSHQQGVTDVLIGLPPRVARFYVQYFAFDRSLATGVVKMLDGQPVELLHLDLDARAQLRPVPMEQAYFAENPVAADVFAERYQFPMDEVANSVLGRLLPRSARPVPSQIKPW